MTPGDLGYLEWSPLRLYSLDTISAGGAFEPHHHEDVEIVTINLEGVFEHRDSAGGVGIQPTGCIATTSTCSGIEHTESATADGDVRGPQIC